MRHRGSEITTTAAIMAGMFSRPKPFSRISWMPLDILPSVTSVFYIYLLKENFEQVPDSLYKAAKVDGTSDMKYLLKVLVPISRSAG